MAEKPRKKKRIVLTILLVLFLLILTAIAVPIGSLYAQYHNISYAPSDPVERTDTYTLPAYPEVIPGSEGITDFPDATDIPPETTAAPQTEVKPETTEPTTTDSPVTIAPVIETTAPAPVTTAPYVPPVTLPSVTYAPPTTQAPVTQAPVTQTPPVTIAPSTTKAPTTSKAPSAANAPVTTNNNSFANSPNAVNIYGHTPIYKVAQKDPNVLNILILGTDSRDVTRDRGRSDTMIVVSYNKAEGTIKMVSLLRDSLVPIEGYGWNRINTAYIFGGVGLAINTVNQLFGLDIQHFVVVDINGAKNFIDYAGGVDVQITEAESKFYYMGYGKTIPAGYTHLNGEQAVLHMRNRSTDNDFGRTRRQRDVITALFKQIITEESLNEIYAITGHAMGLVKTNIPASTLTSLAASIVLQANTLSLETQNVPYSDAYQYAWYNGMAILSFDIAQTAVRIHEFLY